VTSYYRIVHETIFYQMVTIFGWEYTGHVLAGSLKTWYIIQMDQV